MRLSPCFAQSRQNPHAQTRRENGRTGICARRGGNNAVMQTLSRPLVIVCFGTPAIAGDSLGPEVGTLLRSDARFPAFVYGTLDRPVTGKNMTEWMKFLREAHKDAVMLAVDACLGERTQLGKITVRNDGVCPAAVGGRKTASAMSESSPSSATRMATRSPNSCRQMHFMCQNSHIKWRI